MHKGSLRPIVRALMLHSSGEDMIAAEARRAVRAAWQAMCLHPLDWYLYYVPGTIRFAVAQEIPPPFDEQSFLPTGYRVSSRWSEDEMVQRIRDFARTLPTFGGVR